MPPTLVADSLVNAFGVAGLVVGIFVLVGRDHHGTLARRFVFGLLCITLLYGFRGLAWITGSSFLMGIALIAAAFIPLAALIVVEGLLRRHAPRWVKQLIAGGGGAIALAIPLGLASFDVAVSIILALFQTVSFFVLGWMIFKGRRLDLTAAEQRSIDELSMALLILMMVSLTDYRDLFADIPVRMSPIGVLVLVWLSLGRGGADLSRRMRAALLAIILAISITVSLGAAATLGADGFADIVRLSVIAVAGALFGAIVLEAMRVSASGRQVSLLSRLAAADLTDLEGFLRGLSSHPLLRNAPLLEGERLTDFDTPELRALLARRPLLRAADRPWGLSVGDRARDQATALLATYQASHLILVSERPLRILALGLPPFASDPATEWELQVVQRMARLVSRTVQ